MGVDLGSVGFHCFDSSW